MTSAVLKMSPSVMLVEDSLPIRQRLHSLIEESGRARVVAEASSVKAALAEFERAAPDAVVLDLQLTDGTGYTVLEAIKRSRPMCRVIVMTNFAEPETRERCLELGADHVLEKSTDFESVPGLLAGGAISGVRLVVPPVAVPGAEHHYRHLLESVAAAIYTCDAVGRITFYNAAAADLWGCEPVLGADLWCGPWRIFEPDGRPLPLTQCPMALAIRDGQAIRGREVQVERLDGKRLSVLQYPQPLFDAAGKLAGAINMLVDITPLRLAEAEREHAQVSARITLDSLTASICVLDEHGRIINTNGAWRSFGQANGSLTAATNEGADYLAACDRGTLAGAPGAAEFGEALRAVVAGRLVGFDTEYPCHSPSEQRWFDVRISPLAGSKPLQVVVSHVDITARKLAELALAESEERWQFAVEGTGDGVWDRDLTTDRCFYSPRWKAVLGYAEHEISNSPDECLSRLHPDDRASVLALSVACRLGFKSSYAVEFRMRCKDGSWKWIFGRSMVVSRGDDGVPLRLIGTHSDISQRKQADAERTELERQLRDAQKLEAVGTMASSIAHDFNNIMGAVLGNVALARLEVAPDHRATHYLEQLEKAGLRARSMVQRILALSRRQHLEMQTQWLQPMVQEEIELLRATLPSGVTLNARLSGAGLGAHFDATQLSQVLMNLGTNAWHALQGDAGQVEIGLEALPAEVEHANEERPPGQRRHRGRLAAACAHLWVRDEGCGMDEATRARAFEPFFTTKRSGHGTGLGLAVVRRIVQEHGGTISLDTAPGCGSCFHIYLPLVLMPEVATDAEVQPPLPDTKGASGKQVMYIDDDEFMSMMATDMLQRFGLRVTCFEAAEQALAALAENPQRFDLVVTDFNMPRQSGIDVAKAVAILRPGLPVIITSGNVTQELVEGARRVGVRALINKERTFEDLAGEVLQGLR